MVPDSTHPEESYFPRGRAFLCPLSCLHLLKLLYNCGKEVAIAGCGMAAHEEGLAVGRHRGKQH
jgi:hypothetical protein